jgi:hypothetical protein
MLWGRRAMRLQPGVPPVVCRTQDLSILEERGAMIRLPFRPRRQPLAAAAPTATHAALAGAAAAPRGPGRSLSRRRQLLVTTLALLAGVLVMLAGCGEDDQHVSESFASGARPAPLPAADAAAASGVQVPAPPPAEPKLAPAEPAAGAATQSAPGAGAPAGAAPAAGTVAAPADTTPAAGSATSPAKGGAAAAGAPPPKPAAAKPPASTKNTKGGAATAG